MKFFDECMLQMHENDKCLDCAGITIRMLELQNAIIINNILVAGHAFKGVRQVAVWRTETALCPNKSGSRNK